MLKKLLGLMAVGALVAVVAPAPAQATHVQGLAVFAGDAQVGPDGLCLPGLDPTEQCAEEGTTEDQTFTFNVPGSGEVSECVVSGTFGTTTALGDACSFDASGDVTAVAGTGPSCGLSHGEGSGSFTVETATPVTFGFTVEWPTSAGGTLPLVGSFDGHQLVGLVQARPLTPGACVTAPATTFTVVGTVAVLPV